MLSGDGFSHPLISKEKKSGMLSIGENHNHHITVIGGIRTYVFLNSLAHSHGFFHKRIPQGMGKERGGEV